MAAMSDNRCQACHRVQFASFSDGHPEFRSRRVTGDDGTPAGIPFDHLSHMQSDHFGDRDFDCRGCHELDASGDRMRIQPFAGSCAGCHSQGRTDHHGDRIKDNRTAMIQLPYVEFDESDPYWPEDAAGTELSWLLLLLLGGDDEALDALRALEDEDVDWIPEEWYPDTDDPKLALITAIKRAILELSAGDADALVERLARVFGGTVADPEIAALTEQLNGSRFTLQAYQQRWLRDVAADLEGRQVEPATDEGPDWDVPSSAAGWQIDAGDVAVTYRPTGHADAFLKAWIDALVRYGAPGAAKGEDDYRGHLRELAFEGTTRGGFLRTACLRCHSIDEQAAEVDWNAAGRSAGSIGYGRFRHASHLHPPLGADGCSGCHQFTEPPAAEAIAEAVVEADAGAEAEPEAPDAALGMLRHRKESCAGCHTSSGAGDSCLTCHQYHRSRP